MPRTKYMYKPQFIAFDVNMSHLCNIFCLRQQKAVLNYQNMQMLCRQRPCKQRQTYNPKIRTKSRVLRNESKECPITENLDPHHARLPLLCAFAGAGHASLYRAHSSGLRGYHFPTVDAPIFPKPALGSRRQDIPSLKASKASQS